MMNMFSVFFFFSWFHIHIFQITFATLCVCVCVFGERYEWFNWNIWRWNTVVDVAAIAANHTRLRTFYVLKTIMRYSPDQIRKKRESKCSIHGIFDRHKTNPNHQVNLLPTRKYHNLHKVNSSKKFEKTIVASNRDREREREKWFFGTFGDSQLLGCGCMLKWH